MSTDAIAVVRRAQAGDCLALAQLVFLDGYEQNAADTVLNPSPRRNPRLALVAA
jgi:hypothetical protein